MLASVDPLWNSLFLLCALVSTLYSVTSSITPWPAPLPLHLVHHWTDLYPLVTATLYLDLCRSLWNSN